MTSRPSPGSKRPNTAIAFLFAAGMAVLVSGYEASALPLPPPPPLPLPLPPPPIGLPLGPPALPTIPSFPQVFPSNAPATSGSIQLPVTSATLDAKLLIVSADGSEPVLGAIRRAAEYAGMPYTLYIASQTPGGFTPSRLSDGGLHAYYQGIVLTTGTLGYLNGTTWTSAFSASEWQTLWDYQARYRVRTAIGYAFPTADLGYGPATGIDATTSPISASLTASGRPVFAYVNADNPLVITKAWAYLAPAAGTGTSVLLSDSRGDALALVRTYPDGRQVFSMTFDGNYFLVHSLALMHGVLNWVTGGLFIGERHIYMSPQVDDIFIDNDQYGGGNYRINGVDWTSNSAWQTQAHLQSQEAGVRIHMAFNGEGTTGTYFLDTLTPAAEATDFQFPWINHTYSHENLDSVSYEVAYQQITRNNQVAASMGFADYSTRAMVTPDVSGLAKPAAMQAAWDAGVRFLVTDTSRPGYDNPTPQAGIRNPLQPGILMIPRRPTNLYYNVSTPTDWKNEYNVIYRNYWGRDLTYDEILDKESEVLLQYLLRGEVDPWMFHQANMRAYDAVHTLLGDLFDRALAKYKRLFVLPIRSPSFVALGEWVDNRMRYSATDVVRASFSPSQGTMTITASDAVVVPVTGLCSGSSETYGGQCISHVPVGAGQTVVLSFPPTQGPGGNLSAGSPSQERVAVQDVGPNPFTRSTRITLALPERAPSRLAVYDVAGRVVRTLANRDIEAGIHSITWDGRTDAGAPVGDGVYFVRLESGGSTSTRLVVRIQ